MDKSYTYLTAFLPYWWAIFSAGTLFGLDAIIRDRWPWGKAQLDRIPREWRKRIEIGALVLAIFYAGYEAWVDEYSALQKANNDIGVIQGERDEARRQRDSNISPVQTATINRLSGDLEAARGKIDAQTQQMEAQEKQLKEQAEEIARLMPKPDRVLTDQEKQNLARVFTPLAAQFPTLQISATEGEPQSYAAQLKDAFNAIGIKVDRVGLVFALNSQSIGMQVVVKDHNNPPTKADQFLTALHEAGFPATGTEMNTLPPDQFLLVIGKQ